MLRVLCCAVQVEMTAASLYVNLTVIKSMSVHITGAGFMRGLCLTLQTDAQGQSQFDEALTPTVMHPATPQEPDDKECVYFWY